MGMFFNNANCDIYIGKGAGKKLLKDIENADHSIKIISPYLSPFLIKKLIRLDNRSVSIQLITTDKIEDYKQEDRKVIKELIIQNIKTDNTAVLLRKKWCKTKKVYGALTITSFIASLGLFYYFRNIEILLGLLLVIIFALIYNSYKSKIKNKRIYSYTYSQLFPFKVYMSPYESELSDTFIHGKIYIIDDTIAYLGSVNFTTMGTKYNYETRIRTTDPGAITKIKDEFDDLFDNSNLPYLDIQHWGKQLYPEPIN